MIAHVRKFIAAAVGMGLLHLHQKYGVDLTGNAAVYVDTIISFGTLAGVWWFKNEEA
jgi:hypothetical protein